MTRRAATNRLTDSEAAAVLLGLKQPSKQRSQTPGRQKYGARAVEVDGVKFASQVEARRYQELRLRELAGEIKDLELQPRYRIDVNDVHVCDYIADFRYLDTSTGRQVVEDVKGFKTREYRLKNKLMKAVHGVDIREILEA